MPDFAVVFFTRNWVSPGAFRSSGVRFIRRQSGFARQRNAGLFCSALPIAGTDAIAVQRCWN